MYMTRFIYRPSNYVLMSFIQKEKRVTGEQHQWDLGAVPVWARGITGKGIGVTVVDDGKL